LQYSINVRAPEYAMDSMQQLKRMPISAVHGGRRQARKFWTTSPAFDRVNVAPVVSHYNVMPVIDVYGNVDGRDLGGVLATSSRRWRKGQKELPRGSSIIVRGQAETMHSSYSRPGRRD
jgi:multidrug efflux pump subunit AcrB